MTRSSVSRGQVVSYDVPLNTTKGEAETTVNNDTDQEIVAVPDRFSRRFLSYPQQIFRRIITQVDPQAKGESNQQVYEKEKRRFRKNQFIWYILIAIEILLLLRFILKVSNTDPSFGFARIIYPITDLFVYPFSGISGNFANDGWSTVFAGIVYLCIAWGAIYLMHLVYPITPKNLETK